MKQIRLCLCLAALMAALALACIAEAETGAGETCWTTLGDSCYHLSEDCVALGEKSYTLPVEEAISAQLRPCPICAAEERASSDPAIEAAERGGTWVIKFPKALLAGASMRPPAQPALQYSLPMLYARTLSDDVNLRLAVTDTGSLHMNLRVIDGNCYLVERPPEPYSEAFPMKWEARQIETDIFGVQEPTLTGVTDPVESVPALSAGGYRQVFNASYDGCDIAVYRALDCNIAVVHRQSEAEPGMYCQLTLDGRQPGIPVQGYSAAREDYYVYCCVLTDDELGALVAGALPGVDDIVIDSESPSTETDGARVALPDLSGDVANDALRTTE